MKGGGQVIYMVVVMAAMTMLMCSADGRRIDVGGKMGWKQGINYTVWASQQPFYVGDWLYFGYDKNAYDVLEVNQTNYENCNSDHFITNITRGAGRDVFELKEAKPYYFICSKGYCYGGMKLAINVTKTPPPTPTPQGNRASQFQGKIVILLVLAVVYLLLAF